MKFWKEALCIFLLVNCLILISAKRKTRFERLKLKSKYLAGRSRVIKSFMTEKKGDAVPEVLNTKVLVSTQVVILSSSLSNNQIDRNQGCPDGMVFVKDKGNGRAVDLNMGAGGEYLYLCARYKSYIQIVMGDVIVNRLTIQENNTVCSDGMQTDGIDLNFKAGGAYIYLCRGNYSFTRQEDNYPITSLMTVTSGDSLTNYSFWDSNLYYVCLNTDLNKDAGGKYQYLCYHKESAAPQKVEYHGIVVNLAGKVQNTSENMKVNLDEYTVQNGDGGKELSIVGERSLTDSTSNSSSGSKGVGLGISKDFGDPEKDPLAVSLEVTANLTWSSQTTTTTETTATSAFECTAPPGRYVKCQLSTNVSSYTIPYTYTKTFTLYNGSKVDYPASGTISQVAATDIEVSACCYNMCKKGDILCADKTDSLGKLKVATADGNQDACKMEEPEKLTVNNTPTVFTLSSVGLVDADVLVDIKMIKGSEGASCSNDYSKIDIDIMQGNGGKYVYICAKYVKVSKIEGGMNTINQIIIQYGTSNCGKLKNVTTFGDTSDSDADGTSVYICFGRNDDEKKRTISRININKSSSKPAAPSADEEQDDPITMQQVGDTKYLHITRHKKVPKSVVFNNFKINGSPSKSNTKMPNRIDSILVYGSSVTRKIETSKTTETTSGFSLDIGMSVTKDVGVDVSVLGSFSSGSENVKSTTNTESQEITCQADPNKVMRCSIYKSTQRMISTYTVEQTYYGYDDQSLGTYQITGELESKESGSVSVKTCCVEGCCTGDATDKDRDQCWDTKKNESKGKDITCAVLENCMKAQATAFKNKAATVKNLAASTIKKITKP